MQQGEPVRTLLSGARSDRFRGLKWRPIENADDDLNVALLELKFNTTKINIYSQLHKLQIDRGGRCREQRPEWLGSGRDEGVKRG